MAFEAVDLYIYQLVGDWYKYHLAIDLRRSVGNRMAN